MSLSLQSKRFEVCPSCGAALRQRYAGIGDLYEIVDEHFAIAECTSCGLALTNPQPQENLQLLYPDTYLSQNTEAADASPKLSLLQRSERWYREDQSRYDFELLRRVAALAPGELQSYCDIGCGTGDRVAFVHKAGCKRALGIDSFDFFTALSDKDKHFLQCEILDFKPEKKFQLVSLFHVLEHLPQPALVLQHIADHVLQSGGYLYIQVPNYGSIERAVFGSRWSALDIPRHFWHFRADYLRNQLQSMNYSVLRCYQRNALLHPVTTAASLWRDLHIQRIWVKAQQKPSLYWTLMKLGWMAMTVLSIPWNIVLNMMSSATMLSVIARAPQLGTRAGAEQK